MKLKLAGIYVALFWGLRGVMESIEICGDIKKVG